MKNGRENYGGLPFTQNKDLSSFSVACLDFVFYILMNFAFIFTLLQGSV